MAGTLKELCEDDPDLRQLLHSEITDLVEELPILSFDKTTDSNGSKLKRVKKIENELSNTKHNNVIPVTQFLRSLQSSTEF